MPSTCVFEFDRPVYYSGDTIKACIKLNTTNNKDVRRVYLEFIGRAKVKWEKRKRSSYKESNSLSRYYRSKEIYLNQRTDVFEGDMLQAGLYTYTIEIPLPTSCPTSCMEIYGHIRYEISLIIDRPFRFDNKFSQPITVIKQLNLNLSPEYMIPLKAEDIKYFNTFCCYDSEPLLVSLSIPFGGYVPGQKIKYTLELDNRSKYDLRGFTLRFQQNYKFIAHTPSHKTCYHSNTLAESQRQIDCLRLTKRVIENKFTIPSVPPTSNDCSIITVNYSLKMSINCGTCHGNSEMVIPITIGTVPLIQSASGSSHVQPAQPPTAPNMTPDDLNSKILQKYKFSKPPSFEEATTVGEKGIDHDVD